MEGNVLKAGIVGLGMAGNGIVPALAAMPNVELVAAADPRENALAAFRDRFHGRVFESFDRLCADPDVEAVWVATPTRFHCDQVVALAEAGKHVVVEKPMAVTLAECERMVEAAERNHVTLIAGGSRSFDPAFVEMRRVIDSGRLGGLRALATWSFVGWITRPREPHEVDVSIGGGTVYNQAPHPVDVLRLLGGGKLRSVRAMTRDYPLDGRPCPGYFNAYLEFEDGTPATLVFDGNGYMLGWELLPWGETAGRQAATEAAYAYRRAMRAGTADEHEAREKLRFGGREESGRGFFGGERDWTPQDAGLVVVSCERGVIRQSAAGLYIYDDDGRHDEPLPGRGDTRANEVADLVDGMTGRRKPLHDGRWGMATLEAVLAIMQSAAQRHEVYLSHQVGV
jgi:phthalate 4,5-cis-dihydrodiol dehydrogenase